MYLEGSGVAADSRLGQEWTRKAAENGEPEAQLLLGSLCLDDHSLAREEGEGVSWIRKAAEQGLARAQFLLAVRLLEGRDAAPDPLAGIEWLHLAPKGGESGAAFRLTPPPGRGTATGRGPDPSESPPARGTHRPEERAGRIRREALRDLQPPLRP